MTTDTDVQRAAAGHSSPQVGGDGCGRGGTHEVPDSVLGKVDRLLAVVASAPGPLGLSELSRHSGIPKATVHRLVSELVDLGLLEKIGTAIVLGRRLFELGHQVPGYRGLTHAATPYVEDLYLATRGATVHFGVRDGFEMMYLMKVRGHEGVQRPSRTGGRIPIHCTATGRALLSAFDDDAVEEVIARGLRRMTPYTTATPAVYRELMATARREGVAMEREEVLVGYGAVASPIFDAHGPVAALGVAAPLSVAQPSSYASTVRATAQRLSQELRREQTVSLPV